jgi:hypothetical protein
LEENYDEKKTLDDIAKNMQKNEKLKLKKAKLTIKTQAQELDIIKKQNQELQIALSKLSKMQISDQKEKKEGNNYLIK